VRAQLASARSAGVGNVHDGRASSPPPSPSGSDGLFMSAKSLFSPLTSHMRWLFAGTRKEPESCAARREAFCCIRSEPPLLSPPLLRKPFIPTRAIPCSVPPNLLSTDPVRPWLV